MTPTPTPLDLAAIRVIAEGATEGPWRIYTVTDSGGRSAAVETAWAHDEQGEDTELVTDWCSPEDAAHIVAFDPPTALALLDRVTAAESSLARYIVQRTRFGDAMAAAAVPAVVDAIMRELTADSDKRAREATARAEAAEAKIAAVRTLHRPVPVYTTEMGDCEHGDDCEGVEINDGAYCPVHTDGLTCNACAETGEHMEDLPAYPCPTIAALDGTA